MIESYFGLSRRPFLAIPDVNAYSPNEFMESARTSILRCLRRGEGISLIVGQSGVGKSLLLRLLAQPFQMDYPVAMLSNVRLKTPKAFLQQVLFELHLPFCGSDENELRLLLWDHLRRSSVPGVLLLIDEAQSLSLKVLEEIRTMMSCDDGTVPKFRVALAGTYELEEKLTHPKLIAFNQWIVSRSYLEPLTRKETSEYIIEQVKYAKKRWESARRDGFMEGESPRSELEKEQGVEVGSLSGRFFRVDGAHFHGEQSSIFDEESRKVVHELTEGIPRLINQLCDHTLVLVSEQHENRAITADLVRRAWAELQQIPDPTDTGSMDLSSSKAGENFNESSGAHEENGSHCIVEFGELSDCETDSHSAPELAGFDILSEKNSENTILPQNEECFKDYDPELCEEEESEPHSLENEALFQEKFFSGKVVQGECDPKGELEEESKRDSFPDSFEKDDISPESNAAAAESEPGENDFPGDDSNEPLENEFVEDTAVYEEFQSRDAESPSSSDVVNLESVSEKAEPERSINHAYQRPTFYESVYPDGPHAIMDNWAGPGHRFPSGSGTSYREILYRNLSEGHKEFAPEQIAPPVVLPQGMEYGEQARTTDSRFSLPGYHVEISEEIPGNPESPPGHEYKVEWGVEENQKTAICENPEPENPVVPQKNEEPEDPSSWESLVDSARNESESPRSTNRKPLPGDCSIVRLHFDQGLPPIPPSSLGTSLDEQFDEEISLSRGGLISGNKSRNCSHIPGLSRILVKSPDRKTEYAFSEYPGRNERPNTAVATKGVPGDVLQQSFSRKMEEQSNTAEFFLNQQRGFSENSGESQSCAILSYSGYGKTSVSGKTVKDITPGFLQGKPSFRAVSPESAKIPQRDEAECRTLNFQREKESLERNVEGSFSSERPRSGNSGEKTREARSRLKLRDSDEEENLSFPKEHPRESEPQVLQRKSQTLGTLFSRLYRRENTG